MDKESFELGRLRQAAHMLGQTARLLREVAEEITYMCDELFDVEDEDG